MGIASLDVALKGVCPILGVSSSGRIDFAPEATAAQRTAAQAIAAEWDYSADDWRVGTQRFRAEHYALAVAEIKNRCRADIEVRYPAWKQRNMTARAVDLATIRQGRPHVYSDGSVGWVGGRELTSSEAQELLDLAAAWEWMRQRRLQSDAEEAALE